MKKSYELVLTALAIALGILLPMGFHLVSFSGKMFLPMYYPIALFAYLLRPFPAFLAGLITPLLSSLLTGMPPFNPPVALQMAFELALTGTAIALLSNHSTLPVQIIMIIAVLIQKLIFIFSKYIIAQLYQLPFASMLTADLLISLPGTLILLFVIPPLAQSLRQAMHKRATLYAE